MHCYREDFGTVTCGKVFDKQAGLRMEIFDNDENRGMHIVDLPTA